MSDILNDGFLGNVVEGEVGSAEIYQGMSGHEYMPSAIEPLETISLGEHETFTADCPTPPVIDLSSDSDSGSDCDPGGDPLSYVLKVTGDNATPPLSPIPEEKTDCIHDMDQSDVMEKFDEPHWTAFTHKVEDHFAFPMEAKDYMYMRYIVSKNCLCQEEYFKREGTDCGFFIQPIELDENEL